MIYHEDNPEYWKARLQAPGRFNLKSFLFDKQLAFVTDPSPFKIAVCSRRAGKTVSCAAHLIETATHTPQIICLYITLSRANAKRILWKELQKINQNYKLQGKENLSELSISFKNGSTIYLSGANDSTQIQKFKGLAVKLCYIDEVQAFKSYIEELIDDVISPSLIDYAGTLCLIGTPGPVPMGYFHDCATKQNSWSKHSWTYWDNPFIPIKNNSTHRAVLDRELNRMGVTIDHPSIQREWFGKWVLDLDSLLLHYDPLKNHYEDLPQGKWQYIMGIDLGFEDADAIAVLAWCEQSETTYLIDELVINKQGLSELAAQIRQIQSKFDISKLLIDEGGLGKKLAEELRRRFQIPVSAADKSRKMENVAFLNDALRTGRFKAKKNSRFAQECMLVEIDREKTTPERIVIKDSFHSDIIDAVLYAFKESPAYTYEAPITKSPYLSPAWAKEETERMEAEAIQYFQKQEEAERGYGWD